MEVLTKSGLKSLWDKLKDSFILKKGGGTIVTKGIDSYSDYSTQINNRGIDLVYKNDFHYIMLNESGLSLKAGRTNAVSDLTTIEPTRLIISSTTNGKNFLSGNKIILNNGISLTGFYDDTQGNKVKPTISISMKDSINELNLYPDGIEYAKSGKPEELFSRDGTYKTIGVDIAPLKDGIIPLDNLPSLNYVPNNEASTIRTTSSYYNIGDERLLISKYEDATYGDTGSFISLTPPTKDVPDDVKQGELKMVNTYEIVNPITNIMSLTNKLLSFTWITNDGTYNEEYTSLNAGNLTLSDSTGGRIQMWTRDGMEMKPKPTIQLVGDTSIAEYTDKGIYFQYKQGYVIGAQNDFYQLNAVNGIPQLDANGKLSADVLPSTTITDVQVNGTSVVSNGIANITGLDEKYVSQTNGVVNSIETIKLSKANNNYEIDGYGIDMNNSDLIGINQLRFNDISYSNDEGILFPRSDGKYDSIWSCDGNMYYSVKKEIQGGGTNYTVFTTANLASYLSSGKLGSDIYIKYRASENLSTNPKLIFSDEGGQQVGLVYSDYDAYRASKGLKVMDLDGDDVSSVWFEVQGSIYAGGSINGNQSSDIRLKENLKEADSLDIIESLGDVYTFTYKDTKEDSIGLIAQNVKDSQLSDLVTENKEGYLGINYWSPKLVCLALGAAQQLNKKVKELEKQIEELKSK